MEDNTRVVFQLFLIPACYTYLAGATLWRNYSHPHSSKHITSYYTSSIIKRLLINVLLILMYASWILISYLDDNQTEVDRDYSLIYLLVIVSLLIESHGLIFQYKKRLRLLFAVHTLGWLLITLAQAMFVLILYPTIEFHGIIPIIDFFTLTFIMIRLIHQLIIKQDRTEFQGGHIL